MIDRNDLDLRVNTYRNQIQSINQTHWQTTEPTRPAGVLRQQIASVLVSLAGKLDGNTSASFGSTASRKPASGFAS